LRLVEHELEHHHLGPTHSILPTPSAYPSPPESTSTASSTDTSPSSSPTKPAPDIRFGHYFSSGRLADAFTAHLGPSSLPVMVKVIDLESFTLPGQPDAYDLPGPGLGLGLESILLVSSLLVLIVDPALAVLIT